MPEVIIYTTRTCPHCTSAKAYLVSRNIKYIEKDVGSDRAASAELASANIMGVPAFRINGEFIVGLDKNRIEDLIKSDIVRCPSCDTRLRIPANKGKLRVTCRECMEKFDAVT